MSAARQEELTVALVEMATRLAEVIGNDFRDLTPPEIAAACQASQERVAEEQRINLERTNAEITRLLAASKTGVAQ